VVTLKRPAAASVTATVLLTPGKTLPKSRLFAAVTVMGVWTLAETLIWALF
jgi:hypothetical protein